MPKPLNIAILAAGAAGMICGSCLRDNNLALALRKLGHNASLVPLYTPLKVDTELASADAPVFYGGVNVYLQHASWLFRHTPRLVDWFLDRPAFLRAAGNMGAGTAPAKLAPMTRTMLLGVHGRMKKELTRLIKMLRALKPDLISLPNLMFAGVAEELRAQLKTPIIMELTGEDIFLEAMHDADQTNLRDLIRSTTPHIAAYISTSNFYTKKMAAYLNLPENKITTIYPGVPDTLLTLPRSVPLETRNSKLETPLRVGHLARIDPAKGLDLAHQIVDRAISLGGNFQLHYAGWEGPHMKKWHASLRAAAKNPGTYHGEVDLPTKISFLDSLDIFLAPAPYAEAKGLYVLEAMARGVPIIAAAQGAFLETVGDAGLLIEPGNINAYATALLSLAADPARRHQMSTAARALVASKFTDTLMAQQTAALYSSLL